MTASMQVIHVALIVVFGVALRCLVALHPYSGKGKPPMFGDYEAQRHWMEITYNLPLSKWYENGTDNDLMYWGLDYPPLTAYHSWICGAISSRINSSWVELFKSRGLESTEHKVFMRYSVLVMDVLLYIPAVILYFIKCSDINLTSNSKIISAFLCLIYPGLVLIDYGHFQYNCVSLGLTVWGVVGLCLGQEVLGSAAFVLALNYKQMELYHAVPFFCYLAGLCLKQWKERGLFYGIWKLIKLGLVVAGVFLVCWGPFLLTRDQSVVLQVVRRIFPFARGLYEDKVSNFWCALSVVVKLKELFTQDDLIKICLLTTLVALLPSAVDLFLRSTLTKFKYALINSSLVFFLFSFHVHEKTILLAAIPVCLIFPQDMLVSVWFLLISTFRLLSVTIISVALFLTLSTPAVYTYIHMLPLIVKDKLLIAFISSTILFYMMADILIDQLRLMQWKSLVPLSAPPNPLPAKSNPTHAKNHSTHNKNSSSHNKNSSTIQATVVLRQQSMHSASNRYFSVIFWLSVFGMVILTVMTVTVSPPARYPDLFPLLVSVYSCCHFILFLVYFTWRQLTCSDNSAAFSNMKDKNALSKSDRISKKKLKSH